MNESNATPTAPAPTLTAPTVTTVEPHTHASVSESEAATLAKWAREDLAAKKITAEQAEKIFNELNTPLEQRQPDTRTDEQKNLDKQFPAAKPEDYSIRYGVLGQEPEMTKELRKFDTSARTWMSGAGLPRELGNSLVTQISRVTQQTQRMSPDELITYGENEFAKLEKAFGPKLEEKLHSAALMIHDLDLKQPGLKNLLRSKGIGDNALIASMLMQHASVYHARKR
jgi:hypothetical protein